MSYAVARHQPKTRDLTPSEAKLVEAIAIAAAEGKVLTKTEIGVAAGYGSGDIARVSAHKALARPAVRKALLDRMREVAESEVGSSLAVLQHLARRAKSEAVRKDSALANLRLAGMDASDQAPGPQIQVNIALSDGLAGTQLAQLLEMSAKHQQTQRVIDGEHSLAEGEVGASAPTPAPSRKGKGGGRGVKNRAGPPLAGVAT